MALKDLRKINGKQGRGGRVMLSLFTKVKSAKAEATVKLFTFVTRGSEVPAPRTCPEADYFKKARVR